MKSFFKKNKRGFTIFFAMLVSTLALSVGLAIFDLTIRELDLSATATQSQFAIYAADTGADCALYWDFKYTDEDGSAFGTSTESSWPASGRATGGTTPPTRPPTRLSPLSPLR
jgi:hypothetical protein